MVEQNASLALSIAHRAYVLRSGSIALEGPARALLQDPRIREAYLGVESRGTIKPASDGASEGLRA